MGLLITAWGERRPLQSIIPTLEVDGLLFRKQLADQGAGLLQPVLPFFHGGKIPTIRLVFPLEPAGADAQDKTPLGGLVDLGSHLGHQGRIAVAVAHDQRAELEPLGHPGGHRQRDERFVGRVAFILLGGNAGHRDRRQEVIRKPDAVPSSRFHRLDIGLHLVPLSTVDLELRAKFHSVLDLTP